MGPFALAFVAGVISFASPCCLPLMPGYVSYVSGVVGVSDVPTRRRALITSALFVLGFALVFTSLGASASLLGGVLLRQRDVLVRAAGVLVLAMGLVTAGVIRLPALAREIRIDPRRIGPGPVGAAPLGMAFALGWTPCIGPVLGGILTAAASTTDAAIGATLLFTYSLGLGLPFMLLALGMGRPGRVSAWLRAHGAMVERAGGALLLVIGILMLTGLWSRALTPMIRLLSRTGWPPI